MRGSKRLPQCFIKLDRSSTIPPRKGLADFQAPAPEETATYFCPSPIPFNCKIIECIIQRWHAYRGKNHEGRYRKGSPSSPETITIGYHYNYPISPRSSPLPGYKDASSQVPVKHDRGLPEYPRDTSEEKLWCSSSIYDSDRASDTGKPTQEVQGESATTMSATTTPGNDTNPRIPTLVIATRERSKALSRILVEDQGIDESEKYCEHIKEATDCYISTVEDILEHARRAEKSQWKDLEE